jgi:hypothetical protein
MDRIREATIFIQKIIAKLLGMEPHERSIGAGKIVLI